MTINQNLCCGCVFENDYGTSVATGEGTKGNPFAIELADPAYVRPVARVRRTTNQLITNNVLNVVSFSTAVFDSAGFWNAGSPTLLTMPHKGLYIFGACGMWAANATGTRELSVRRNGSQILRTNDQPVHPTFGGANPIWQTIGYQFPLDVGDTLELLARQESGGSLNLTAEADDSIVFWVMYAGRTI